MLEQQERGSIFFSCKLKKKKSFRNAGMIKIILLETNFELLASTEFQSRIYKAASRKRRYLHDTHGKPPPKPSACSSACGSPAGISLCVRLSPGENERTDLKSNGEHSRGRGPGASASPPQTRSWLTGVRMLWDAGWWVSSLHTCRSDDGEGLAGFRNQYSRLD